MTDLLTLSNVSKTYGSNTRLAVDRVSFHCQRGDVVAVNGGSGSGKTTLLRIIAGLEIPDDGQVVLNGATVNGPSRFVPPEKRDCTLVFQDYALFPNMTVGQNVAFGKGAEERPGKNQKLLELAKIKELEHRYPHEISGGEQQRVALARALATAPSLLLLDEPLSHLDHELRDTVRSELINLFRETETTVVFVSHDADDAMTMADRVVVLHNGRAEQTGSPAEIYSKPANRYTAFLFGKSNLIPLELLPDAPHHFLDPESGGEVVSVRPHQWTVVDEDGLQEAPHFSGKVVSVQSRGDHQEVELEVNQLTLTVNLSTTHLIQAGNQLTVVPSYL